MDLSSSLARFERLAGYAAQDPHNESLHTEAREAAAVCAMEAQGCIAHRRLGEARDVLERLLGVFPDEPAVRHDLAYVHLLSGEHAQARALLQDVNGEPAAEMFQALWLRACHALGDLEPAWRWAERANAKRTLSADAAGVASLVALDLDEPAAARALADVALADRPEHHEALVTRGSLLLLQGAPAPAAHVLRRALSCNPEDGRTWSTLGFASLLARDLSAAREQLERGTHWAPLHGPTWQALGWTRLLLDDRAGALAAFRTALACAPEAGEAHGALALACALAGDGIAADQHATAAERIEPEDVTCKLARAVLVGAGASDVRELLEGVLAQWTPRP